eukprot:TRINITY_DN7062_c0_g2_i3.p1 TRINITY_DN7062_c0_g2~~TRINITY_DN7062_c0_g2_i3.p1  ORF type:complete len:149 (+),score=9.05 TRINITY_DN7062_c0_g2_i3:93-539(+)
MRREVSLSKNTVESLETRLLELQTEMIETKAKHSKRIVELETLLEKEKTKLSHYVSKSESEQKAIEAAIKTAVETRESLKKSNPELLDKQEEQTQCGVCLERPRDALVAPCGHISMCEKCARAIKASDNPQCPYCRVAIIGVYKTYHV